VSHGHELGTPTPARLVARYQADILVFGHTHRALVTTVGQGGASILVVNPGAAGPRRFDRKPSVAILTVTARHAHAEIVTL
jgi:predicted phosphodiesterase